MDFQRFRVTVRFSSARKVLGKKKAIEVAVPYRTRVGEAVIHTWGDGWKNLRFL